MPSDKPVRGGSRGYLTSKQMNLFVAGTNFRDQQGRLLPAFRGMALRSGKAYTETVRGVEVTVYKERIRDKYGNVKAFNKSRKYPKGFAKTVPVYRDARNIRLPSWYQGTGTHKIKGRGGLYTKHSWRVGNLGGETVELKDLKDVALQLAVAAHMQIIQMEHWKFLLAQRAMKIFQESFELKRFNSDGEPSWRPNTRNTYLKRVHKGTWPGAGKLMMETGALAKSFKIERHGVSNFAVTTGPAANGRIYAGVHNNPKPGMTYGKIFGARPVTQRQFMGHSTKIDEFIADYESRYLFDMVFRRR